MNRIEIAKTLQRAHDEYFGLLIKNYPTIRSKDVFADFGQPEMCDLAIEVHACAIALGATALTRLNYIGLSTLYPFDNPVDLYNWREHVKTNRIDHTTYASIAIRIDSELKRLRKTLEFGSEASYDATPNNLFLVSKERYASLSSTNEPKTRVLPVQPPQIQIGAVNITNSVDSAAVSRLEQLESKTTVWSNFSNVINTLRTLLGA